MSTKRIQFEALEKGMGKPVPELQIGDVPEQIVYIWNMYAEIKRGCSDNVTYQDIQAYCQVCECNLLPFEAKIVIELDSLYWSVYNE